MRNPRPHLLPATPDVSGEILGRIREDHDRFARAGLPEDLDRYLRQAYDLDMTASYAGIALRNPWGKASGQLSLNRVQIEEAAEAGLGLVVLKTVIAQDAGGRQSMSAWAIKESQMVAEPIQSLRTGATGWTVTWKGRGWWQPFTDYLLLIRAACSIARRPRSSDRPIREVPPARTRRNRVAIRRICRDNSCDSRCLSIIESARFADAAREGLFPDAGGLRPRRAGKPWFSNGSGAFPT